MSLNLGAALFVVPDQCVVRPGGLSPTFETILNIFILVVIIPNCVLHGIKIPFLKKNVLIKGSHALCGNDVKCRNVLKKKSPVTDYLRNHSR